MYPFSFQNPTRIEFGLDKEKEMGLNTLNVAG